MSSPYEGHSETQWADITRKLVADYPLGVNDIVDAVLAAWDGILKSNICLPELYVSITLASISGDRVVVFLTSIDSDLPVGPII